MTKRMKMKINSKDFRVRPGEKVKLEEWPTTVRPICGTKNRYQKLLGEHVAQLTARQRLHYASDRYALLLIFQGMFGAQLRLFRSHFGLFGAHLGVFNPRLGLFGARLRLFGPRLRFLNARLGLFGARFGLFGPRLGVLNPRLGLLNPRFRPFDAGFRPHYPRVMAGDVSVRVVLFCVASIVRRGLGWGLGRWWFKLGYHSVFVIHV
jgi:hypothetical protein